MTEPITARVLEQLTETRKRLKVSAQELADRMTAAGYPIKRAVIANLETGRRTEVSVGHLAVAAQVLGVDAATILRHAAPCSRCHNKPPAGFACRTCGTAS